MLGNRRFPRYPANLRLRLHFPAGQMETTTEEISLEGFSAPCPNMPEAAGFPFSLHLPDGKILSGTATMRPQPGTAAGFSCQFSAADQPLWEAFLEQEQFSGGIWRMIARYATSAGKEQEAVRGALEKGPLGILFKRIGGETPAAHDEKDGDTPVVMRLHMVGENGEAYRVAFEKHQSDSPDASDFARAVPAMLELARRTALRILTQDVHLKRSPQASIEAVRLVEMQKGGYGYLMQHPGGKPGLMGLHGSELIVIEADGRCVFPFFDGADLERISCDTFRRESGPVAPARPAAPVLRPERFAAQYEHKSVDAQRPIHCTEEDLRAAMSLSQRVQTRTYGDRTLRLFPDLWLEVTRPAEWSGAVRGFVMEDAPALCTFVLVGPGAPRVVRIQPGDLVSIIRGREG